MVKTKPVSRSPVKHKPVTTREESLRTHPRLQGQQPCSCSLEAEVAGEGLWPLPCAQGGPRKEADPSLQGCHGSPAGSGWGPGTFLLLCIDMDVHVCPTTGLLLSVEQRPHSVPCHSNPSAKDLRLQKRDSGKPVCLCHYPYNKGTTYYYSLFNFLIS